MQSLQHGKLVDIKTMSVGNLEEDELAIWMVAQNFCDRIHANCKVFLMGARTTRIASSGSASLQDASRRHGFARQFEMPLVSFRQNCLATRALAS